MTSYKVLRGLPFNFSAQDERLPIHNDLVNFLQTEFGGEPLDEDKLGLSNTLNQWRFDFINGTVKGVTNCDYTLSLYRKEDGSGELLFMADYEVNGGAYVREFAAETPRVKLTDLGSVEIEDTIRAELDRPSFEFSED